MSEIPIEKIRDRLPEGFIAELDPVNPQRVVISAYQFEYREWLDAEDYLKRTDAVNNKILQGVVDNLSKVIYRLSESNEGIENPIESYAEKRAEEARHELSEQEEE